MSCDFTLEHYRELLEAARAGGYRFAQFDRDPEPGTVLLRPFDPRRDHYKGPTDAPLVLVEYGDFECPFCAQAYSTIKALLQKYDGKVALANLSGYRDQRGLRIDEASTQGGTISIDSGNGAVAFAVACVVAYSTSGHKGIYHAQPVSAHKAGLRGAD